MFVRTRKMIVAVILVVGCCIGFTTPAYAYLDPGTGSLLLQGLIATIAAGAATVSIYWHKVRSFFSGKDEADDTHTDEQGQENE
jgi:uncharacterized membrane protein